MGPGFAPRARSNANARFAADLARWRLLGSRGSFLGAGGGSVEVGVFGVSVVPSAPFGCSTGLVKGLGATRLFRPESESPNGSHETNSG